MALHYAVIKNFGDYLAGREVEATIHLKNNESVSPGEKVLAIHDSIAATTDLPVPRSKQDEVIGIEGTITEVRTGPSGSRIEKVIVKKI